MKPKKSTEEGVSYRDIDQQKVYADNQQKVPDTTSVNESTTTHEVSNVKEPTNSDVNPLKAPAADSHIPIGEMSEKISNLSCDGNVCPDIAQPSTENAASDYIQHTGEDISKSLHTKQNESPDNAPDIQILRSMSHLSEARNKLADTSDSDIQIPGCPKVSGNLSNVNSHIDSRNHTSHFTETV